MQLTVFVDRLARRIVSSWPAEKKEAAPDRRKNDNLRKIFELTKKLDKTENSLVEKCNFMQQVFNAIPSPVYYKGKDQKYKMVNRAFCEFLGRSADFIIGKTTAEVFPKDLVEVVEREDKKVLETGEMQTICLSPQTLQKWSLWIMLKVPYFDMKKEIKGIVGMSFDFNLLMECLQRQHPRGQLRLVVMCGDKVVGELADESADTAIANVG